MSPKLIAVPKHVGFIMDGNRRWANRRGVSSLRGHKQGYYQAHDILEWCLDRGIRVVTLFTFSHENWNRPKAEVAYLMRLMGWAVRKDLRRLQRKEVKLNIIGRLEGLPVLLQRQLKRAMEATKHNTRAVLNLAINYGGRTEIVDAVKRVVRKGLRAAQIDEATVQKFLYAGNLPDPDLIIRTSGEQRTSGFLLWEAAYAELYFSPKKWPDFSENDLDKALADFARRKRNFGA